MQGFWKCLLLVLAMGMATLQACGPAFARVPPKPATERPPVRLNGQQAMGKTIGLNITFTDMAPGSRAAFRLTVKNAVLNYGQPLGAPDAGLTLNKSTLAAIMLGLMTMEQARERGLLVFTGRPEAFAEIMSLLGTFAPLFPIVAPRDEDWGT